MENVISIISEALKDIKCVKCAFWRPISMYEHDDGVCTRGAINTDSDRECNIYTRAEFYCKEFVIIPLPNVG